MFLAPLSLTTALAVGGCEGPGFPDRRREYQRARLRRQARSQSRNPYRTDNKSASPVYTYIIHAATTGRLVAFTAFRALAQRADITAL